jgi:hypothetical protein
MIIESIIDDVRDHDQDDRPADKLVGIMIHRVGLDYQTGVVLGYDARSICDAFLGRVPKWAEVARATGSENAYTLLIGGDAGPLEFDGRIWQALALDEKGQHARRFSAPYLGVACIGDFRARIGRPPSRRQHSSLVSVVSDLCLALGFGPSAVVGHGEVRGSHDGSKAPGKPAACPGDLLDMRELRKLIAGEMPFVSRAAARARLSGAGLVFPGTG